MVKWTIEHEHMTALHCAVQSHIDTVYIDAAYIEMWVGCSSVSRQCDSGDWGLTPHNRMCPDLK